jgi:hypothetical protein
MVQVGNLTERFSTLALILATVAITATGCSGEGSSNSSKSSTTGKNPSAQRSESWVNQAPAFSGDSAYSNVAAQVDFGTRVPNSPGHKACGDWLIEELEKAGAQLHVQEASVTAFDGTVLAIRNIIGSFNPEDPRRILLYAHWDTRPWADNDPVRIHDPIDGANDGASGVGVLLEIARLIQLKNPQTGVDIAFFDAEDYGSPSWIPADQKEYTDWCLGSQYWARKPHVPGYRARMGILLDMVGAGDAVFNKEGTSNEMAPGLVDRVWTMAHKLGHGDRFRSAVTPITVDDNLFVTQLAHIPSVNIVHYHIARVPMGYFKYHHTHGDNMSVIDPAVLQEVGEVVAAMVWNN